MSSVTLLNQGTTSIRVPVIVAVGFSAISADHKSQSWSSFCEWLGDQRNKDKHAREQLLRRKCLSVLEFALDRMQGSG